MNSPGEDAGVIDDDIDAAEMRALSLTNFLISSAVAYPRRSEKLRRRLFTNCSAVSFSAVSPRAQIATFAPSRANPNADALPIPWLRQRPNNFAFKPRSMLVPLVCRSGPDTIDGIQWVKQLPDSIAVSAPARNQTDGTGRIRHRRPQRGEAATEIRRFHRRGR